MSLSSLISHLSSLISRLPCNTTVNPAPYPLSSVNACIALKRTFLILNY